MKGVGVRGRRPAAWRSSRVSSAILLEGGSERLPAAGAGRGADKPGSPTPNSSASWRDGKCAVCGRAFVKQQPLCRYDTWQCRLAGQRRNNRDASRRKRAERRRDEGQP